MQDSTRTSHPNDGVRSLKILTVGVLAAVLVSGCSIWPKSLTFGSKAEPEPAQAAAPTPMPAAAPASAEPKQEVAVAPVATSVVKEAASQPMPAAPVPEPAKMDAPAPKAVVVAPTIPTSKLLTGFYINVGLFAVPSNGTNAHLKLEKAGLPVLTDSLQTKKGLLTRVRVGPFSTRPEAEAAAKQIRDLQLEAIIFKR